MYEKLSNSPFLTLQLDYSAIYLILLCEHTAESHSIQQKELEKETLYLKPNANNRQKDLQVL